MRLNYVALAMVFSVCFCGIIKAEDSPLTSELMPIKTGESWNYIRTYYLEEGSSDIETLSETLEILVGEPLGLGRYNVEYNKGTLTTQWVLDPIGFLLGDAIGTVCMRVLKWNALVGEAWEVNSSSKLKATFVSWEPVSANGVEYPRSARIRIINTKTTLELWFVLNVGLVRCENAVNDYVRMTLELVKE